jgi:hypothetical protein
VTPLFAAMGPIAIASIEVELVRVMVACSVGTDLPFPPLTGHWSGREGDLRGTWGTSGPLLPLLV